MVERNAEVAPDKRIEFRIGIHLGDVVEEADGDLMGATGSTSPRVCKGSPSPEGFASPTTPIGRLSRDSTSRSVISAPCR
jgi:class 3 adenylate cyclase